MCCAVKVFPLSGGGDGTRELRDKMSIISRLVWKSHENQFS